MRRFALLAAALLLATAAAAGAALRPGAATAPYVVGEGSISFLAAGVTVRVEEAPAKLLAERLEAAGAPADPFPADRFLVLAVTVSGAGGDSRLVLTEAALASAGGRLRPLPSSSFQRQGKTAPWASRFFDTAGTPAPGGGVTTFLVFRRPADGPVALEGLRLWVASRDQLLRFPFDEGR